MQSYEGRWTTVRVDVEEGIGWVTLNRPEKRNAMSPRLNREMRDVLETLELDEEVKVLVLTGAGESWTAGMDLKEYFREVDQARGDCAGEDSAGCVDMAMETLADVRKAHDRNGERLVFRGRVLTACGLRSGDCIGDSRVRTVRDQLGHTAREPGEQSARRHGRAAKGARVHHDGRDVHGRAGRGDGAGQSGRAARDRLRQETIVLAQQTGGEESGGAACGEAWIQALPRTDMGAERGLPVRQARPGAVA
jgi:hypothetical protein